MNVLSTFSARVVLHILETSWQAAVLAVLVVLLGLLLRDRLSARWRCALWLVVVSRLLMPVAPESPVSLFNLFPVDFASSEADVQTEQTTLVVEPGPAVAQGPAPAFDPRWTGQGTFPLEQTMLEGPVEPAAPTQAETVDKTTPWLTAEKIWWFVAMAWGLGTIVLALRVLVLCLRLRLLLRQCQPIADSEILRVFEATCVELGVRRRVALVASPLPVGPAVTGTIMPKLIISESLLQSLSIDELRLVFLHELSHVRRHDLVVQQLWMIAEVLHWFNPAVWLSARRWQADRELACDEAVLARLDHSHQAGYGHAILRVMESLSTFRPVPGAVGVVTRRGVVARRIARIARYRPLARGWTFLAAALLLLLIPIGLTNAVGESKEPQKTTDEQETVEGWGPERDGLRTRLVPVQKQYQVGQPARFKLEMKNFGDEPREYDAQGVVWKNSMKIIGPDGKPVRYVAGSFQSFGEDQSLAPGESVVLRDDFDVAYRYLFVKPGVYTLQFLGKDRGIWKNQSPIPPSNEQKVEFLSGKLPRSVQVPARLLKVLPKQWDMRLNARVSEVQDGKVTPPGWTSGKGTYVGLVSNLNKKNPWVVKIWVAANKLTKVDKPRDARSTTSDKPAEYLGKGADGYVYWSVPNEAKQKWPDIRRKIGLALGIDQAGKSDASAHSLTVGARKEEVGARKDAVGARKDAVGARKDAVGDWTDAPNMAKKSDEVTVELSSGKVIIGDSNIPRTGTLTTDSSAIPSLDDADVATLGEADGSASARGVGTLTLSGGTSTGTLTMSSEATLTLNDESSVSRESGKGTLKIIDSGYITMTFGRKGASKAETAKLLRTITRRLRITGIDSITPFVTDDEQVEVRVPSEQRDLVDRVQRLLSYVGVLEFRILANKTDHKDLIDRSRKAKDKSLYDGKGSLLARWVAVAPGCEKELVKDKQIATRASKQDGRDVLEVLVVKDHYDVSDKYLDEVEAIKDEHGRPCVKFSLTEEGAKRMAELTTANSPDDEKGIYRKLGILLEDKLYSAPVIQTTIRARGQITGSFTQDDVDNIVAMLNARILREQSTKLDKGPKPPVQKSEPRPSGSGVVGESDSSAHSLTVGARKDTVGARKDTPSEPAGPPPYSTLDAGSTTTLSFNDGSESSEKAAGDKKMMLAGWCVDVKHKPVAGVEVKIFEISGESNRLVTTLATDDEGRFKHGPVPVPFFDRKTNKSRSYVISAHKPGLALTDQMYNVLRSGKREMVIVMRPAASLTGRVTDQQGKPIEGATISCMSGLIIDPARLSARTDTEGRFEIKELPAGNEEGIVFDAYYTVGGPSMPGQMVFHVHHHGFADARVAVKELPAKIDVKLLPEAVIEGRVIDSVTGKPAAEVNVWVYSKRGQFSSPRQGTTTDAEGRYRIVGLAAGEYCLAARSEDRFMASLTVQATTGKTENAPDMTLVESGIIEGRIVDAATGKPISKGRFNDQLMIVEHGPNRDRFPPAMAPPVDASGRFRLRVAPGRAYPYIASGGLWWRVKDRERFERDGVDVHSGQTTKVEFRVLPLEAAPKTIAFVGRCMDEKGRPIEGATVLLGELVLKQRTYRTKFETTTGRDGRFRFKPVKIPINDMRADTYTAYAIVAKKTGRASASFEIYPGTIEEPRNITLEMPPAASLRGRVTDPAGKPIAGALVAATMPMNQRYPGVRMARTDARGQYEITDLAPWPAADPDNATLTVDVYGFLVGGDVAYDYRMDPNLIPGPGIFRVEHPDYAVDRIKVKRIPAKADATLTPGGVVEGRLVDAAGGKPLADVQLSLHSAGSKVQIMRSASGMTDNDGRFRVKMLSPGKYQITAMPKDRPFADIGQVDVEPGKTVHVADTPMVRGGIIRGRIVDAATGQPIANGRQGEPIFIYTKDPSNDMPSQHACIGKDGRFELHVMPGINRLFLTDRETWKQTERRKQFEEDGIEVKEGETVTIELRVRPKVTGIDLPSTSRIHLHR